MTARISNLYGQLKQISYCIFISLPQVMGPENDYFSFEHRATINSD